MSKFEYWSRRMEEAENLILPGNYRHLKRHIRKLEANGSSERTRANHLYTLIPFLTWCKTAVESLIEDDILDYCEYLGKQVYEQNGVKKKYTSATLYTHKSAIKSFLGTINAEASKAIKLKLARRALPEILDESDILKMISACRNSRDRALIACLYESGARKGELLSVRIKHVTFDENGCVVILPQGKTGPRRIRLVFAASYLREWIEDHHTRDDRESIVFCSHRYPHPALSDTGICEQLEQIAEWAGIKKPVNPHAFRHAAATRYARLMTEQELKVFLGWTPGSDMAAVYVHLSGEDIDDSILRIHGIKSQTKDDGMTVERCPRCKDLIPEHSAYCRRCGLPLQDSVKQKIENDEAEIDIEIIRAALLNPAILEEIAKRVKLNEKTD